MKRASGIYLLISLLYLTSAAIAAPINNFAVIQEKVLTNTSAAYVARHPDSRFGESIDIGQKLLLQKFSGEGTARLIISNSSEALTLGGQTQGEGESQEFYMDTNGSGTITPIDALRIVNYLNRGETEYRIELDVNRDGRITAIDSLIITNYLNRRRNGGDTSEGEDGSSSNQTPENISDLPAVEVPNVRLINDADVKAVGTVIMDFDIEQDLSRINYEGIGIDLTQRDGQAFVMNALYNAPGRAAGEIHIDVFSSEHQQSRCIIRLSEDTTELDVTSSQAVVGVPFEDCIAVGEEGGANFSLVGAIVVTINATKVAGAQFLITAFRTDGDTLCNVENCNISDGDPSVPPSSPPPSSPPPSSVPPSSPPPSSIPPSSPPSSSMPPPSSRPPAGPSLPPSSPCPLQLEVSWWPDPFSYFPGSNGEAGNTITGDYAGVWAMQNDYDFSIIRNMGRSTPAGACFNAIFDDMENRCHITSTNHWSIYDDCFAGWLGVFGANLRFHTEFYVFGESYPNEMSIYSDDGNSRQIFFNQECEVIPPPDEEILEECSADATFWFTPSPISLILSEVDEAPTFVNFSLDPYACPNCLSEWKASESKPLLVYDPDHTGNITSATQLFGNWTFGGKKLASTASSVPSNTAWANGYEALGTLDTNQDKVVSGSELRDLGLWFDRNRDGVSGPGEVIPAVEYGITKLHYTDYSQQANKDLVIQQGFELTRGGKTTSGSSIDWFGAQAKTTHELLQKKTFETMLMSEVNATQISNITFDGEYQKVSKKDPILGAWHWRTKYKEANDIAFEGVLVFGRDDAGDITGISLNSLDVVGDSPSEIVSATKVQGKKLAHVNNEYILEIKQGDNLLKTNVSFERKTSRLYARTTVYSADGTKKKLEYNWTAIRYEPPAKKK